MGGKKFRVFNLRLHAFFGLHVFAILALTFFSGSLLTFIWEIQSSLNSDIRLAQSAQSHDATFGQIFDNISAFDPNLRPVFIERSANLSVGDRTVVQRPNGRKLIVWSHPQSGEILGVTNNSGLRKFVFDYHVSMMTSNRIGALVASGMSILLLGFVVTGLIAYPRFWRGYFRAPPRHLGAYAWWGGLHRLIAVWIFPFLLLMGLTGFYFFAGTANLISVKIPQAEQVSNRANIFPPGFDGTALERVIDIARNALPGLDISVVNLPFTARHGVVVFGSANEIIWNGRSNTITVDPVTLQILGLDRSKDLSAWQRTAQVNSSLHTGVWGGFYVRLAWLGLGVASTMLTLAGAMVYASRVARPVGTNTHSAVRRIWAGMSVLKWGLVLYGAAVTTLAVVRYAI